MRILFVLLDFPFPAENGFNAKAYGLIQYMAERHECDIVAVSSGAHACDIKGLRETCPRLGLIEVYPRQTGWQLGVHQLFMLGTGRPAYFSRFSGAALRAAVAHLVENRQYDAIHVDMIGLAGLTAVQRVNAVLSINDAISAGFRQKTQFEDRRLMRAYYRICLWGTRRLEKQLHKMFPMIHVVTKEDAAELQAVNAKLSVKVIPLAARVCARPMADRSEKIDNSVLLVGNWSTNFVRAGMRSFIREVWPGVKQSVPWASLKVLPRFVDRELRSLESDSCRILGFVDDYDAEVRRSSVVVFPEPAGTGMRTRVLDAMAAGKALVLSPFAARGFDFGELETALICRNPKEFASRVGGLLSDPHRATALGEALKALARTKYSIDRVGRQWEQLYESLRLGSNPENENMTL